MAVCFQRPLPLRAVLIARVPVLEQHAGVRGSVFQWPLLPRVALVARVPVLCHAVGVHAVCLGVARGHSTPPGLLPVLTTSCAGC
jgi:hypothetical protein